MPQGGNIAVSDLVYQFPGVSQDSTSSGDFHVRNDHANVQFRINGIQMPDGVSGFSQFLDTGLFSKFSLITGALPAQYGLHTVGVLDITTKTGAALSGGSVGVYGGSNNTITPTFEYGGVTGNTEYFCHRTLFRQQSRPGEPDRFESTPFTIIPNSAGSSAIPRRCSTIRPGWSRSRACRSSDIRFPTIRDSRLTSEAFAGANGTPAGGTYTAWGVANCNSSNVNENQYEKNSFAVVAWQKSIGNIDMQLSYYNRYSELHFVPDPVGDMLFNNIATDVFRSTSSTGFRAISPYQAQ